MKGPNLSEWSVRNGVLTRYFIALLLVAGILSYFKLGQNEDPAFTFRTMLVSARLPGATALQVEAQLTDRMEHALQSTPWVDTLRSYSKPGEATLIVALKGAVPPGKVPDIWYDVRKRVRDIAHTFPAGTQGPFFDDDFGETDGALFALAGDGFSDAELKTWADRVRHTLLRVPDVKRVNLYGEREERVFIELDQQRLAASGVTLPQVIGALAQQNAIEPAGAVSIDGFRLPVRVSGQFDAVDDIADLRLSIPTADGLKTLRVGDFAMVARGFANPATQAMRFNGSPVIGVGVIMAPGGDMLRLGNALTDHSRRISEWLPAGMRLEQVANQPRVVNRAVMEFMQTLAEALLIVLVVSFVSLGLKRDPWRVDMWPGLVVALTIPLTLSITFLIMWMLDIDLQKVSLGALIIALGLLVDDAIIAVEMMVRKLEEGADRLTAATEMYRVAGGPMLTGTLVIVAGFLPVGFAQSTAGEYTFSIFAVNAIALLVSWVVAVTFTPYLGELLLKTPALKSAHVGPSDVYDSRGYNQVRALLNFCIMRRWWVIGITLVVFVVSIFAFKLIPQQFFPDSAREELVVDLWMPEGSSFEATSDAAARVEAFLASDVNRADVASVATWVGRGSPRFYLPFDQQLGHANLAQLIVLARNVDGRNALRERLRVFAAEQLPDVRARVYPLSAGPPVAYPVQFRVVGPDAGKVREYADAVAEIMRADPDLAGVNDDWNEPIRVVRLDVDQARARALGVSSSQIAVTVQTVLSGTAVGTFRDGDKAILIEARQPEANRLSLEELASLQVRTHSGKSVPLSQLARIRFVWEPGIVWRLGREPAMTVQADVVDGVQGPAVSVRLQPAIQMLQARLDPEYRIVAAGTIQESLAAQASIDVNMPFMVAAVLTLLMIQLRSLSLSLMVLVTAPLGLIGATATLLAFGAPFGFVATLGVVALAGMIMRNSVILLDQIERAIGEGGAPHAAIVEAAVMRFRPIMLTAGSAVLAMIPLTRSIFWGPMAVAIMGGLVVATVLTLFFLPALYAAWFNVPVPEHAD